MKKSVVFGVIAGFAAGAAAAITGKMAVDKVVKEIKGELSEESFISPDGNNIVTLYYGTSKSAKGLTYVNVKAASADNKDSCQLVILTRKRPMTFDGEWTDNDNFMLLIGNGKRKQCCDVTFDSEQITARYYLLKV